jgi:DNA-binding beta-propeller fold protein YncE
MKSLSLRESIVIPSLPIYRNRRWVEAIFEFLFQEGFPISCIGTTRPTPETSMKCVLSAAMVFAASALAASAQTPAPVAPPAPYADFRSRAIVTISDADMLASAYINGQLGPRGGKDALTVTRVAPDLSRFESASVEVSNSVAGAPTSVAVTRDGRFAFVTESIGQRQDGVERFSELQPGTKLTAIDLSNLAQPRVSQTLDIGRRPQGLTVHPAADLLALTLHPVDGRQLVFVPLRNGRMGEPQYVEIPGVDKALDPTHVEWHPSGDFIAVNLAGASQIAFFRVTRDGGRLTIAEWGNRVVTSKYPYMGRFTPDGRHFITSNLFWGPDVPGTWAEAVPGDITSISFATEATQAVNSQPQVRHFLVGKANVAKDPEGLAISPDGRHVVTVNLELSYGPAADARMTPYSSISLMRLDPQTGRLTHLDTTRYDGILPESAVFDASGRYLSVVTFGSFNPQDGDTGFLDFFRVTPDEKLVKLRRSAPLPRGPHSMQIIN